MGSILLLGVLGSFFLRIRIPNSVILMVVGILIGPVGGFLNGSDFQQVAPFFGTIALILILFEGGLEIDIYEAVGQASSAFLLGLVHFTLAVLGVCFVGVYLFDQEPLTALLYGFVLGGTSPAVVMPVLTNIKMEAGGRALYSLETVVVEVLTVVSTVLAVDFSTSLTPPALVEASFFVLHAFGTAAGIAVLAAWAWNWVMPIVEKSGMSHLVTLQFPFYSLCLCGLDSC